MRSFRHNLEGMGQKANRLLVQGMAWRVRHIPDRHFVLILSGLVGVAAGLGAVVLKGGVHLVQRLLRVSYPLPEGQLQYLGYPLAGLLLTVFIRRYLFGEKPGQGIADILYAIARKSSQMPRSHMFSRVLTSICTVGFGGSAGLEAPSMVTGAAVGANLGQAMHLKTSKRTLLIGCGAAGALAAIFNAPIAGVVFSVELILAEASIQTFIPLLISSATATLVSQVLADDDVLFAFRITDTFRTRDLPYYLVLGLFTGLLSLAFVKIVNFVEGSIERIDNALGRALVGGALLGVTVFFLPGVYGEGYGLITALLNGNTDVIQLRIPGSLPGTAPSCWPWGCCW
jgi:CIC family chloride channel protein